MKIKINKKMKELLSSYDCMKIEDNETKKKYNYERIIDSYVIWHSDEDSNSSGMLNINYLKDKIELDKKKDKDGGAEMNIWSYSFEKPSEEPLDIMTSFITIWIWASTLKKTYPKEKFMFYIQYDKKKENWVDWREWDVPAWFFVFAFHKRDWERLIWDVHKCSVPFISVEI